MPWKRLLADLTLFNSQSKQCRTARQADTKQSFGPDGLQDKPREHHSASGPNAGTTGNLGEHFWP
jgi:hypothetical protein